jgi:hypothetical protein
LPRPKTHTPFLSQVTFFAVGSGIATAAIGSTARAADKFHNSCRYFALTAVKSVLHIPSFPTPQYDSSNILRTVDGEEQKEALWACHS